LVAMRVAGVLVVSVMFILFPLLVCSVAMERTYTLTRGVQV
jgi:hypothetical protein